MFQNNLLMAAASISAGGFSIDYSCRFNDNDSAKLSHTTGGTPTDASKGIFGTWLKRGNLAGATAGTNASFVAGQSESQWLYLDASNNIYLVDDASATLASNLVMRDPSAWYHIIMSYDSDEGAAADRIKIWLNGVEITSWSLDSRSNITSGEAWGLTIDSETKVVGALSTVHYWDGYLAQTFLIDGTSIQNGDHAITAFGEFDDYGVWRPIDVSGLTFGTNGWLLDFADSSALGNDVSGNDNDFSSSGLAADDQVTDTPTKNFCTLNPLVAVNATLTNGNLSCTTWSGSNEEVVGATQFPTSGKWYWEGEVSGQVADYPRIGIIPDISLWSLNTTNNNMGYNILRSIGWLATGEVRECTALPTTYTTLATYNTYTDGDIIGVALDLDNGKLYFSKNGTFENSSDPAAGTNPVKTGLLSYGFGPGIGGYQTRTFINMDFGQSGFTATPPVGFKALSTDNMGAPTILDGTANFQTTLYAGNATDRNISQTENSVFQPDMVWIKNRSQADGHKLIDAARGISKEISSDSTAGESTDLDGLQSFSDKLWIDASGETLIGNSTSAGGLAKAWDGDNIKGYSTCAASGSSPGTIGIDWGSGETKSITQMIIVGSSDYGYSSPGRTINIKLEGSTDNFSSSVVDLGGGTGDFTDATAYSFKLITPTDTTAYRYHRAYITSSVGSTNVAQVQFFESNTGDTRGFTLGNGPSGYNDNSENFVAWQWLAGGGAGSSNEEGSINTITTTVNTEAGISVSTYTGTGANATIGHGLTNAPNAVWGKRSSGTESWMCWFEGMAGTDYFGFDAATASATSATVWNSTVPSSTLISLGSNASINGSSATNVIWCFESIEGFSSFFNYVGNGLASGPLVHTGFKPAWVMFKRSSGTNGDWIIYDNTRSPYNEIDDQLFADTTAAETTGSEEIDFTALGFQIRTADSDVNTSAANYVYAAFAEHPFGGGEDVTPATTF